MKFLILVALGAATTHAQTGELSPELAVKLQIAAQHVKANQPREAIAALTEFLSARTDMFSPYMDRGKAYHGLKDYAKAITDYSTALKLKPDLSEAYLRRCVAQYEVGNHTGAIEDCDKYISLKPRNMTHEAYYYKGMAHAAYKKYQEAIDDLTKAFEINNDLPDAHMLLGKIYTDQDQLVFAMREYSIVIQQVPGHKQALKLRAAVKASLGDEAGSQADLARAK